MARLPNFFVAGAARSGTTSMWKYLQQHPDIYMPQDVAHKEPSYFCNTYGYSDYHAYLQLFDEAGERKMTGEASGTYLSSPESPGLIKKSIPEAKFIIMLRNPVDRAYSLYKWMHHNKYEQIRTFEEALYEEQNSRLNNKDFQLNNRQYYYNYLYFNSGLYYEQVKRYLRIFGREQVHIIIFEEFKQEILRTIYNTYIFLNVDPHYPFHIDVHNEGPSGYSKLSDSTRKNLEETYLEDISKLSGLIQKPLLTIWFS